MVSETSLHFLDGMYHPQKYEVGHGQIWIQYDKNWNIDMNSLILSNMKVMKRLQGMNTNETIEDE